MYPSKLITILIVLSILINTKAFFQNTLKLNKFKLYNNLMKNNDIPKCTDCEWFKGDNSIYGLCKMFTENNKKQYEYAIHARDNESQCGKEGLLYKEKKIDQIKLNSEEIKSLNEYMKRYSKRNKINKNKY